MARGKVYNFKRLAVFFGLLGAAGPLGCALIEGESTDTCVAAFTSESNVQDVALNSNALFGSELAQSFVATITAQVTTVSVKLTQNGTLGSNDLITLSLQGDSSGNPSGTDLASSEVLVRTMGSTARLVTFTLGSAVSLTQGTTYWIRLSPSYGTSAANHVKWSAQDGSDSGFSTYDDGVLKQSTTGGGWGSGDFGTKRDAIFRVGC